MNFSIPERDPFKNPTPPCAGPMVGANCHGIVTSDVLVKGLSRGAIATRKLKAVNWDKGHERVILVRPLTVKVKPTSSWVGIDVSMTRERDTLCPALDQLFLSLSRQRVAPLYTRVDALWPIESRPAYK